MSWNEGQRCETRAWPHWQFSCPLHLHLPKWAGSRTFQLGDRVKLADTVADVVEKTFLYTKILTIKNEEVMVPSLQALGGSLVNYSAQRKQGKLILHTTVRRVACGEN